MKILISHITLFFLTSCSIAYISGAKHKFSKLKFETKQNKSISLIISASGYVNMEEADFIDFNSNHNLYRLIEWKEAILKAYRDSKLFFNIQTGFIDSDYKAEIRIIYKTQRANCLKLLYYGTLLVFPYRDVDEITIRTKIYNYNGELLTSTEKSKTITSWYSCLFMPIIPFREHSHAYPVIDKTIYDINIEILNEIQNSL